MVEALLLPGIDLIRMDAVPGRQLRHRRLLAHRLQGDPRLECRIELPSRSAHHPLRLLRRNGTSLHLSRWSQNPGPLLATVSLVARRSDINSSLLFKWRKLAREGAFGALPDGDAGFVPVRLAPASAALAAPVAAHVAAPAPAVNDANGTSPVVEIVLPNGCRLRVPAEIEASSLHRLLTVLKTAI